MARSETWTVTPIDKGGHRGTARTLQINWTDPGSQMLRIGSSKGSVGIPTVDQKMGRPATPVRVFEQAIPNSWAATDDVPSDGRPVLVSITGDVNAFANGSLDNQIRAWLANAPAGTMVAALHEGDSKVRKGNYTRAQWVAAQEHFLPLVASMPQQLVPVPILTYQSTIDDTIGLYITAAMRAVPRMVLGVDTYCPGTPSATVTKMVKGITDFAGPLGLPWGIPEIGVGTNNGTDADRASQLRLILNYCAAQGARFVCYWPNLGDSADFTPGPATWPVLGANYPIGG